MIDQKSCWKFNGKAYQICSGWGWGLRTHICNSSTEAEGWGKDAPELGASLALQSKALSQSPLQVDQLYQHRLIYQPVFSHYSIVAEAISRKTNYFSS